MPARPKLEAITTKAGSDQRQGQIQFNQAVSDTQGAAMGLSSSRVLAWGSTAANNTTSALQTMGRGSTDTGVATGAFRFIITGQAASEAKAAVTTATALTAQTVPADTWALYVFDIPTGGTIAMLPAAANATTGYATEALAIAACPARVTAKARLGYITVKTAAGLAWIGATDGLAGGSTGNVASQTNYYPVVGVFGATGVPSNLSLISGSAYPSGLWSGGQCGVLQAPTLAIGSTDVRITNTTAFTFNTGGAVDINRASDAAGTAFGALGTIPADKWGLIAMFINGAGTKTYTSAPSNYTSGYNTEAAAIGDLAKMTPSTGLCFVGFVTIKTKAATAFIVGTDSPAGGATGNVASATNYYPTVGLDTATTGPDFSGQSAAQIAGKSGKVLVAANY